MCHYTVSTPVITTCAILLGSTLKAMVFRMDGFEGNLKRNSYEKTAHAA